MVFFSLNKKCRHTPMHITARCITVAWQVFPCKPKERNTKKKPIPPSFLAWKTPRAFCSLNLYPFLLPRKDVRKNAERNQGGQDAEEGNQRINLLPRDGNVHAEQTSHHVQRDNDRGQQGDLAEDAVRGSSLDDAVDGNLGKVVAVGPRQHLFEMAQVGHHGYHVVLNIAQVQTDVHTRRDLVVLVAALGEALEDVSFSTEQAHQAHDVLARDTNLLEELGHVV